MMNEGVIEMKKYKPPAFSPEKVNTLFLDVLPIIKEEPPIKELESENVLVVGDIHGDFDSLLRSLTIWKKEAEHVIFLGDIVDRGSHQVEALTTILYMVKKHQGRVHLLRGNHETEQVCKRYGFMDEAMRLSKTLYRNALKLFAQLPYAMVLNQRLFLVHGGIAKKEGKHPAKLTDLYKLQKTPHPEQLALQLLWNDPLDRNSWFEPNYFRGQGTFFYGKAAVEAFLSENGLSTIVRAHEVKKDGYEQMFEGKLWTIFSSNDYYQVMPHVLHLKDGDIIPVNVYDYEPINSIAGMVDLFREV